MMKRCLFISRTHRFKGTGVSLKLAFMNEVLFSDEGEDEEDDEDFDEDDLEFDDDED